MTDNQFLELVEPLLEEPAKRELNDWLKFEEKKSNESGRHLRTLSIQEPTDIRFQILWHLWKFATKKPIPKYELVKKLEPYFGDKPKPNETLKDKEFRRGRLIDTNKNRINSNARDPNVNVKLHINLVRKSKYKELERSGYILLLDPSDVEREWKYDEFKENTKNCDNPPIFLELNRDNDSEPKIGDKFSIKIHSPFEKGWLNVFVFSPDGLIRITPLAQSTIRINKKEVTFPNDFYPHNPCNFVGQDGLHGIAIVITIDDIFIQLSEDVKEIEALRKHKSRGVTLEPSRIWDLPKDKVAVGYLEFDVQPKNT